MTPTPLTDADEKLITQTLAALAGPGAALRPDQRAAVEVLLTPGARALVVQATGWGKSAVYWVATALLRARRRGPTVVVSPLLSLMRDQVAAAQRAGLRGVTVNSSNVGDWAEIEEALRRDAVDVLLISPERLADPGFGQRVLDQLLGSVGLIVIDEAHAVSDWGHDFRPDYRRVTRTLTALDAGAAVLATTATANKRVVDDVAGVLGQATFVQRGPLARPSLELAVVNGLSAVQRFAWVVEHLPKLPGSGIVYALTIKDAERLAAVLSQAGVGPVAAYHGQLDSAERERLEADLLANRVKALVATSALGMGYDKPDLGFVVHVGSPGSPVAYYQQIGRAGRAIETAQTVLLASPQDAALWDYFATASLPEPQVIERVLGGLDESEPRSVVAVEADTGVRRTRVELVLKQLAVSDVVRRQGTGWLKTGTPFVFDQAHYDAVLQRRRAEADLMRQFAAGQSCLMVLLQTALDDDAAQPCGRCSVCRSSLPQGWHTVATVETVQWVRTILRRDAVTLEPRKMWPSGSPRRGKMARPFEPGRVLAFADAPEWADLVESLQRSEPAAEALTELSQALIGLLGSWRSDWAGRPTMVCGLNLTGRDWLADTVRTIGEIGQLPAAGVLRATPPEPGLGGAAQVRHWWAQIEAMSGSQVWSRLTTPPGGHRVLLLVDELTSTWPLAVITELLREAGVAAVLPLAIHQRP